MAKDNSDMSSGLLRALQKANDSLTVSTLQVQQSINSLNWPKPLKAALLWLAAWTLKKRGFFSFLKTYVLAMSAYILTRPGLWEAIVNLIFPEDNRAGKVLLSIVQFFDGTVDHFVVGLITVVVVLVATYHFIIKYRENHVRKELKAILSEITFNPEENWFDKKCDVAIKALGSRYSSDANYKNPKLSNVYKALVTPERWVAGFKKSLQKFVKESQHLYNDIPETIKQKNGYIANQLQQIIEIYNSRQYNQFSQLFDNAKSIYEVFRRLSYTNREDVPSYKINPVIDAYREIEANVAIYQFYSSPVLYVKGIAGTGKSHLLADIVTVRKGNHQKSLLALGLDFTETGDVRKRLQDIWGVKGTWDDFLKKLDKIGEIENDNILIAIDGINEGLGNQLWPTVIASIEAEILQYKHLALVVSARTFSQSNMLDKVSKGKATITMEGFRGMEDEAIKYLTGKFGITIPQISQFKKEFSNPLFLKLYCQAYSETAAPAPTSFMDVIKNYLNKVNEKLANKYGYESSLYPYTQQVAACLTELYVSQTDNPMVKYRKFDALLAKAEQILPNGKARDFLQDLVSEGVLMSFLNRNGEILVDFNFDLVGDYMYAAALIEKQWNEYISRIYDDGIYEATCVLLPLMKGIEIFDYAECGLSLDFRQDLFVRTLKQRFSLSQSAIDEIKRIEGNDLDIFYEIIPVLVTHPECHEIIEKLNHDLKTMSMVERDASWSMHFTIDCYDPEETELVKLAKWVAGLSRKSTQTIGDQVAYQTACVLSWGFSSPYRLLRDVATKAAINLLQDKPGVLTELIDLFDDVNDPYIQQRLYAVVHGCVFRGECSKSCELGKKIYEKVFAVETVRPDILLRDYARCAVDYISQHVAIDGFIPEKIKPPYGVKFSFSQCPDRNTVESKYNIDESMGYDKDTVFTQNKILRSMETEYSNGTGGYGDFGRYTFESYIHRWDECEGYSASLLRNFALDIIFEKYKFDARVYSRHDSINDHIRGNRPVMERFGKKFQWIALYEVLGLLQDNYLMESWVSNDKNVQCDGTWDPHVRDIDTTNAFANYYNEDHPIKREESLEWLHIDNLPFKVKDEDNWLKSKEGMSKELVRKSIVRKDDKGDEWIVLYGYNTLTPNNTSLQVDDYEMGLWEFAQAYVVPRGQRNNVVKYINKNGTQGRDMPEYRNSIYELFYKDYYSSASYREYAKRSGTDLWDEFGAKKTAYQIGYRPYTCEGEMSAYRLCKQLFDVLNLKDGECEGEYVDDSGRIIAFDPSVKYENGGQLLVRKKELVRALNQNGLSLVWPLLFEKQKGTSIIGNQFGGAAYMTARGKIKVSLRLYQERRVSPKKRARKVMLENRAKLIWYTITFNKVEKARTKMKMKLAKMYAETGRL